MGEDEKKDDKSPLGDLGVKRDAYAALRIAPFRNFQLSRFTLTVAVQMAETIIGRKIYEITHDKLALGLLGLAEALPFIVTAIYSGHAADTFNRYRIASATIFGTCLCFLGIGLMMSGHAPLIKEYGPTPIYILIGISVYSAQLYGAGASKHFFASAPARIIRQRRHLGQ